MIYTAIVEPTFLAVLALSGQVNNIPLSYRYYISSYGCLSQSPLFLLILALCATSITYLLINLMLSTKQTAYLVWNNMSYLSICVCIADRLIFLLTFR